MKNKDKEKQKTKQKEFSASPFKALKGASLELHGAPVASAPPKKKEEKPAKAVQELSDELLFFEAVAGVRRLSGSPAPAQVKAQQTVKARRDEEDHEVFFKALEALRLDVRFSDQIQDDEPAPRPAAVNRLRQVRRGGIRIDLQLDLHGLTRDEALENLDRFVKAAYNRGQKGVLVITGKGNNSPGEPVVKVAVANWLREHGKGMVAEFVQAPSDMGGSGAFVVFFKEKKVEPEEEVAKS
ncbi:Smr/MutS family protein [Geomonas sp. Red69]|uniref:Smr/MutS family protein n=1 Tax=Geomonas diazotrophica TaxID=2843197 RepID=UPI001C124251|nr:Smr/MutS family protein [Geomonas diazotrophica]MBU5635154.1 Smr/MutS family protein [Geomonas diazotrophica]